jgi:hypothetical protein
MFMSMLLSIPAVLWQAIKCTDDAGQYQHPHDLAYAKVPASSTQQQRLKTRTFQGFF